MKPKFFTLQAVLIVAAMFFALVDRAQAGIIIGSFENGLSGWGVQDLSRPFYGLGVRGSNTTPGFRFFANSPTDGVQSLTHGFNGNGPGTIEFWPDVPIEAGEETIEFDWRASWDFRMGRTATVRMFDLVVQEAGGGAVLQSTNMLTAAALTPVNLDTGLQLGQVNVSAFTGQTVRLNWVSTIAESFLGPAHLMVDNIRMVERVRSVPEPASLAIFGTICLVACGRRRKS